MSKSILGLGQSPVWSQFLVLLCLRQCFIFIRQGRQGDLSISTIITQGLWKTSNNEIQNNECGNIRTATGSLEDCKDQCLEDLRCSAFNFPTANQECELFNCNTTAFPPTRDENTNVNGYWLPGS